MKKADFEGIKGYFEREEGFDNWYRNLLYQQDSCLKRDIIRACKGSLRAEWHYKYIESEKPEPFPCQHLNQNPQK